MSHCQNSAGGCPAQFQHSSNNGFTSLDFSYDTLVDANDPGFNSEFETDEDDGSDILSEHEDRENDNHSNSDTSRSCGDSEARLDDTEDDDEHYMRQCDDQLRTLALQSQAEFSKQPKSTQMILSREVARLYDSYQQHGSAARLTVAIMAFLGSGDIVTRPVTRVVQEVQLDAFGNQTGMKEQVEKRVIERARLRLMPLPKINTDRHGAEIEIIDPIGEYGVNGKRKASDENLRDGKKRYNGLLGFNGHHSGYIGNMELLTENGHLPQNSTRCPTTKNPPAESARELMNSNRSSQTGLHLPHRQAVSTPAFQPSISQRQSFIEHWQQAFQAKNKSHSQPPLNQQPQCGHQHPTCQPEHYSLTTDTETQSLLLGRNPIIPFRPLADLQITIPRSAQVTPPDSALPTIHRILSLHAHAAVKLHDALIDKYTLTPTQTRPHPPQPPAALFRLGITTALHADLEHMFTPALSHPLALDPRARHLLRDIHTSGGNAGPLNPLEKTVVAKAAGVDEESVASWWDDRDRQRVGWNAVREWILHREAEAVALAKRDGTW